MTTKLLNFKTFLSKAPYQPIGIKPCPKPGQHRHWGRMDCHDIPQKHKKHLKQGIDLHHGMDSTGQIPEGTVPPNAHDFYDDGHHMAAAHGEHTGSKGGICKPGEYPKGSGKLTPFHRHPGADYCHSVTQKHGSSSANKAIAQKWHDTHVADIQASWYEFNEKQGLPQEQATADPVSDAVSPYDEAMEAYIIAEGGTPPQTTAEDVPLMPPIDEEDDGVEAQQAIDQIESPGSVDNPHNVSVNDIIKLKVDYVVSHPAKTYKVTEISESSSGDLFASIEHTETGEKSGIDLSDPNVESVEHWQPEGDAVDSWNPHEFAIGSTFTTQQDHTYEITGIDSANNKIHYTVNDVVMEYDLDSFNEWVTSIYEGDPSFKVNPPKAPDGFQPLAVGDTIGTWNIGNLAVGAVIYNMSSDENAINQGEITEIWQPEGAEETLYRVEWKAAFKDSSGNINTSGGSWDGVHDTSEIVDSNWQLSAQAPEGISQADIDKYLSEDEVGKIPKVGTTLESHEQFANVMPGTVLIASNGAIIHIKDNKSDPGSYHGGMLDYTSEGSSTVNQTSWESLVQNPETFTVQSLPDVASYVKNKGFQLGGKVHSDNFMDLPVGVSFLSSTGNTITVVPTPQGALGTLKKPGIHVDIEGKDGAVYKNQFASEMSELDSDAENGLKIVGLPDGTAVQHVPEPTGATPLENKHGLDKGTKLTVKQYDGNLVSATIVKTHKTKAGQNYTIEYEDGSTTKIASGTILVGDETVGAGQTGVVIAHEGAIYKPGQEPEETIELTLPPLGSEPGNWDEVLTKVDGAMGYQEGGVFKHQQTGDKFYIKFSSSGNDQQVKSEALASQLYELCGIRTLSPSLIDFEGKTAIKSSWDENLEKIKISDMANEPGIMNSFVIDAWLANWDVVGPQHDNMQKSGNQIVKIDSGGALKFGGAGGAKAFTSDVKELESMRDPDLGKVAHKVFQNITEENLKAGAQVLKSVKDSHIDAIVDASQVPDKEGMKATLKARRDDIISKIGEGVEEGGHPGQHKHDGYSGWHSKTQPHSAHLKEANGAHKTLNEGPYTMGGTATPETRIWGAINQTRTAEVQELATKALSTNFLSGGEHAYENVKLVQAFLKENGIKDVFGPAFSGWLHGGTNNAKHNIAIRAALFTLKGVAKHRKGEEHSFWQTTMQAKWPDIVNGWEEGINNAMAIIPYVALSQQYTKAKLTSKAAGRVKPVYRGLADKSSYSGSKEGTNVATNVLQAVKNAQQLGKIEDQVILMPNDGISGFSTGKGTAKSFGSPPPGGKGVMFSKSDLEVEDVLINFNAFNGQHSGEQEILIDSAAVEQFSVDEVSEIK